MKRHLLTLLIIYSVLLFAGWKSVHAQERFADRYNITYVTMNEGLPHNFIDDLYKDSRGFLWISTAGGGVFASIRSLILSLCIPHLKI